MDNNTILALLVLNALILIWNSVQNAALRGRVHRFMYWIDNFEDKTKRLKIADYKEK